MAGVVVRLPGLIIHLNATPVTKLKFNLSPSLNFASPPQSLHLPHRPSPIGNPTILTSRAKVCSFSLSISVCCYIFQLSTCFSEALFGYGENAEERDFILLFSFFVLTSCPSCSILLAVHCFVLTNVAQNRFLC